MILRNRDTPVSSSVGSDNPMSELARFMPQSRLHNLSSLYRIASYIDLAPKQALCIFPVTTHVAAQGRVGYCAPAMISVRMIVIAKHKTSDM